MLFQVPYSRGCTPFAAFALWRKSQPRRLSHYPQPFIVAILFLAFSICSYLCIAAPPAVSNSVIASDPIALNDEYTGIEDTPMTIVGITANDIDDDGFIDHTTIDLDPNQPGQQTSIINAHGTYALTIASGEITFVPALDWSGITSITYTVNDNEGNTSNVAYLYITISSVIDAPIAMDDYASGLEDDAFIQVSAVHINDVDPEGQGFIIGSIDIDPTTLTQDLYFEDATGAWMADPGFGTIRFFPNSDFHGTAMIGYTLVSFTNMLSNVALVYVDVAPTNDAPLAAPNSIVVNIGTSALLPQITANDSDLENNIQINTIDLNPQMAGQQTAITTADGAWSVDLQTGDVTFAGNVGFSGTTSISYVVSDSLGLVSNLAELIVHLIGSNSAPVAMSDATSGMEDSSTIEIPDVTANDSDPNGDEQILTASIDIDQNLPGQQTYTINATGMWSVDTLTGTITYQPIANFNGNAGVWYTVKDVGGLESNPAHVVVTVSPDDDNPIAGADSAQTHMNMVCFIEHILDNDYDLESALDPTSVDLDLTAAGVQHTFTNTAGQWDYIQADEKVQYTPSNGFIGIAAHEYAVRDVGGARSIPASLIVEVLPAIPNNATPIPYHSQFAVLSSVNNSPVPADSWGGTWVDINNDGWEDLFVRDKSAEGNIRVYQNLMGQGFEAFVNTDVDASLTATESLWADFDNDGDNDGVLIDDGPTPDKLYLKNSNRRLSATPHVGLKTLSHPSPVAGCVDYDNDGNLDILLLKAHPLSKSALYRNGGDGSFTKVNDAAISTASHSSTMAVWCDYDNDGFQDLFVANAEHAPNSLFHNNGDGTFEPIASGPVVHDGGASVGACWGDYDRDGDMDLFVANASHQNNFLYKNNGDGTFTKVIDSIVVQEASNANGCSWIDIDNDADLDLYLTSVQGEKYLYLNDGTGTFYRKINDAIVAPIGKVSGQSWCDFDQDGDIDLYASTEGQEPGRLFVNSGTNCNGITVQLQGTQSNRNAVGAHVRVLANGIWQTAQINGQYGFSGQRIHFGIGTATTVDSIAVRWPSGLTQHVTVQNANQPVIIVESSTSTLSGVAYLDANLNCQRDEHEQPLANMRIAINGMGHTVQTDATGRYSLPLDGGLYSVAGSDNVHWQNECPSAEQAIANDGNRYRADVPFVPTAHGHDLTVSLVGLGWTPNATRQTTLTCNNLGTADATDAQLTVVYPDGVSIIDASIPWTSVSGQTYVWDLAKVPVGSALAITLVDAVSAAASVGDLLQISATIHAAGEELNGHNNFAYLDREILDDNASNTMRVWPKGEGVHGHIASDQELTYTIQFQNNGSQTARHLRIENTLPPNLDIHSFQIIAASSDCSYVITDERHITIYFHNIDLASSALSSVESQGVISYTIRPLESAPAGDIIENKATLYFDDEAPVATNDVQNTLRGEADRADAEILLWPNPTNGILHIGLGRGPMQFDDRPTLTRVEITDSKGQVVKTWHNISVSTLDFNTAGLRAGGYQVRVLDHNGSAYTGRFIVTHEEK